MQNLSEISGNIVDVLNNRIYTGTIHIVDGIIQSIEENTNSYNNFIMPGFVDSHIHIESSMLTPYEFARVALLHGTVATVSDPHEIANVLGLKGVYYMMENAKGAMLKFNFGAPSCVPATTFESAGATLSAAEIDELMQRDDILYLSEMMNYPGVLFNDSVVMDKIAVAKKYNKPVDGHAPGLRGQQAANYIAAGISTDHECFTLDEALDKIKYGMKILIREGSAARNFDALYPLLKDHYNVCMFCCDDKHPDELLLGHIDQHVRRSVALGFDVMQVLQVACINAVKHYKLAVGLLQKNDPADFIVVNNLKDFRVEKTVVDGKLVAENGKCFLPDRTHPIINHFNTDKSTATDFAIKAKTDTINCIVAHDGQLITGNEQIKCKIENGFAVADVSKDVLKMVVVNRYRSTKPSIAFIKNFGLKYGAIASSVAHDSHNIIAVGTNDDDLCKAVNLLIENTGGLSAVHEKEEWVIPLPIAGLMSDKDCETIGKLYSTIDHKAKQWGSPLRAPYMTLSFMALLVIPQLKLSDKGLFDGGEFKFTELFV